jgi:hypothetical protein
MRTQGRSSIEELMKWACCAEILDFNLSIRVGAMEVCSNRRRNGLRTTSGSEFERYIAPIPITIVRKGRSFFSPIFALELSTKQKRTKASAFEKHFTWLILGFSSLRIQTTSFPQLASYPPVKINRR